MRLWNGDIPCCFPEKQGKLARDWFAIDCQHSQLSGKQLISHETGVAPQNSRELCIIPPHARSKVRSKAR